MSRKCGVCFHSSRLSIERALLRGMSKTKVAEVYEVSRNSIVSHLKNHMPKGLEDRWRVQKDYKGIRQDLKHLKNDDVEKIRDGGVEFVIKEVLRLYKVGQEALQDAQEERNSRSIFMGIHELRDTLKFYVDLWTMLADEPITLNRADVISSEEWRWLEGVILDILKDEPEMRNQLSIRLLEESQTQK